MWLVGLGRIAVANWECTLWSKCPGKACRIKRATARVQSVYGLHEKIPSLLFDDSSLSCAIRQPAVTEI